MAVRHIKTGKGTDGVEPAGCGVVVNHPQDSDGAHDGSDHERWRTRAPDPDVEEDMACPKRRATCEYAVPVAGTDLLGSGVQTSAMCLS